jgi:hypothetical protein
VLFRRLSCSPGVLTVDAAEEVEASEQSGEVEDAWTLLGRLVEQSLVLTEARPRDALLMHEPVRQYDVGEAGGERGVRRDKAAAC